MKRILVIDDDPDILGLASYLLTRAGYEVLTADNGQDGLQVLRDETVDLLLLDIVMPGMNGWAVCRRLRQHPRTTTLPVVVFTAAWQRGCDLAPGAQPVDGYVDKPFEQQQLIETVTRLIGDGTHPALA